MRHIAQIRQKMGNTALFTVFVFALIQIILAGCTATATKSSGVVTSREATDIWHSYQILPNYKYYTSGPQSQPRYIIGLDDKYHLTSKNWKPVDLTPEMLNKWFNFERQRVGISLDPYGAFIVGPNGKRIGLWYSVKRWRITGAAKVDENNGVSVTRPARTWG